MCETVCVGDVHGNLDALLSLWSNLEKQLGDRLQEAVVVFLGDLCDRGPDTKGVLDFLCELRQSRAPGKTVFLVGNHDLGMAAFLGCLPVDVEHPDLEATRKPEHTKGFWPFPVEGGMHYAGRRWAGHYTMEAENTFGAYGVEWQPQSPQLREELQKAVPDHHKDFLKEMQFVYDAEVPFPPGRVVCVHAGLVSRKPLAPQLEALKARDLSHAALFENGDPGRIAAFSGRDNCEGDNVLGMHPELEGKALLVSGHHGYFHVTGDRIINDRSGGIVRPGRPLEAMILSSRTVVRSE